jgi:hypothetical protein
MNGYLVRNFLNDRSEYALAIEHWNGLWSKIDPVATAIYRWRYPWLTVPIPDLQDGNPIFTAVSDDCRKAVRVIQMPPDATPRSSDLSVWIDTFGMDATDSDGTVELVLACVLSDTSSAIAFQFMNDWVLSGYSTTLPIHHTETVVPIESSTLYTLRV